MNTHHINIIRLANAQKSVPVFVGAISDLNVTAFDDTTITLDWTTPTADNALDYFEVWVNGSFLENTTDASEGWTITGLTAGTSYDIKLKTVDVLGNKSGFSNAVTQSTTGGITSSLLTKTASSGWGNAYATSTGALVGDGYVEFTTNESNKAKQLSISYTSVGSDRLSVLYRITLDSIGNYYWGDPSESSIGGSYIAGDVFRIERIGTTIYFKKNGTTFQTSTETVTTANMVSDCFANQTGATIKNAKINSNFIIWTSIVGMSFTTS